MKRLTGILILLFLIGCSEQKKVDTKAEGEKVLQASRDWSKAAASGDVEKTVSYWADDALMISEGQPPLQGKQAIKQMVEASFKTPGFKISWEPTSVQVSESGDMAYLIEDSQVTFPDSTGKAMTMHNKAVSIWRKQADGSWKNVVDISTPAPGQK